MISFPVRIQRKDIEYRYIINNNISFQLLQLEEECLSLGLDKFSVKYVKHL